jgi:membrane protein
MSRSETRQRSGAPRQPPLWAAVVTTVLFATGFRPRQFSTAEVSRSPATLDKAAGTPSAIPAGGLKDLLLRLYQNISDHRVVALAAGVTFYSLLAIFPAIAALVAIYGLFADPATLSADLETMSGLLPRGAIDVMHDELTRVVSQRSSTLGLTFIVSLAISLWSANAAMKSVFDTLNIVYGERESRSLIALNALSLTLTIGAIIFVLLALGALVVLPPALGYLGLSDITESLLRAGRWPALFIVLTLALAFVYRFGPSREAAEWRWITWGSACAALAWLAVSLLFSWYAENFGNFNRTYGSLGAVIGFMTWIWLSAIVILIGAELDAEMEHRSSRNGLPWPMRSARLNKTGENDGSARGHGRR